MNKLTQLILFLRGYEKTNIKELPTYVPFKIHGKEGVFYLDKGRVYDRDGVEFLVAEKTYFYIKKTFLDGKAFISYPKIEPRERVLQTKIIESYTEDKVNRFLSENSQKIVSVQYFPNPEMNRPQYFIIYYE